jgi:hypothetical protein
MPRVPILEIWVKSTGIGGIFNKKGMIRIDVLLKDLRRLEHE